MSITEISMIHHVGMVLFLLWLFAFFNRCHPIAYFVSLIYLYLVHERYVMRLRRKLRFDERKQANQRRVLTDSETVRWLNHAVEKIWPICMEQIASQKILLPIIPWFLEKYKPWTAKKATVQHLYLGRSPPIFTEMRVRHPCTDDDDLVLELGMNFCTADDMSGILAVKLRKRLGFGMWAKLHITGMHVEGKVLIGVKFFPHWPFLGRLRVCFAEPPYFQMTVKPIFSHGLDVTELPGIAGWLDKLLSVAFEQTLVQPNMLVVDVEKFSSPQPENWFSVDEKDPVAYAKVEVIEASDMKPSDLNGLADPYVKGQLGPYKFRTKTKWKTLAPKWHEEHNIPIFTWDLPNVLAIGVRDKDHFRDDTLGDCEITINDLRGGGRHDMWLLLQNIKMGKLHLAVTVREENSKGVDNPFNGETLNKEETQDPFSVETANRASLSSGLPEKSSKLPDNFEPINVEGQEKTGIWVHQPGSEVSQTLEPRKGKSRRIDTQIHGVLNDSFGRATTPVFLNNDSSSADENAESKMNKVRRGLHKISSVFHRNPKSDDNASSSPSENVPSPYANIRAVNQKAIGVTFIVEDSLSLPTSGKDPNEVNLSIERSDPESPNKGNVKDMAKNIFKHAGKSARNIKHVLSRKEPRKSRVDTLITAQEEIFTGSDSSDDESLSSPQLHGIPIASTPISKSCGGNDDDDDDDTTNSNISHNASREPAINTEARIKKVNVEGLERMEDDEVSSSNGDDNGQEDSSKPWLPEENSAEKK